jgi:hypothetical protein
MFHTGAGGLQVMLTVVTINDKGLEADPPTTADNDHHIADYFISSTNLAAYCLYL